MSLNFFHAFLPHHQTSFLSLAFPLGHMNSKITFFPWDFVGELFQFGDEETVHVVRVRIESFAEIRRWMKMFLTEVCESRSPEIET